MQESKTMKYAIHTSLFTFTQFCKQPLHLGLISIGHLLSWELALWVLSFSPHWHEQTMETIFANLSHLEFRMSLSKCWVAFSLLYWTSLSLSAKPKASPLLGKLPARSPWGAGGSPVWPGKLRFARPRGVSWPAWQSSTSFQGMRNCGWASSAGSVGGWSHGEPRLTHVFFLMEATLQRWETATKQKADTRGRRSSWISGSVYSLFWMPVLSWPSVAWDIPI